jgi:transposase-like protein
MGRRSALTPEQWVEVERRHFVGGESVNSLAKEFGVNESNIRRKISPNNAESKKGQKSLRDMALAKVAAEKQTREIAEEIARLPVVRQNIVNDIARQIVGISESLIGAAEIHAKNARLLAHMASSQLLMVDDSDPAGEESIEILKTASALTKMSNEASVLPMGIAAASVKGGLPQAPSGNQPPAVPEDPTEAARVYRDFMQA